jgi:replicative DNA helicase
VPTAANATFYASIVADKAILRGLVSSGTKITQMGFAAQGEPVDLVNEAQAEIFSIGRFANSNDATSVSDALHDAIDEMEKIAGRNGAHIEIPTGFRELDELTNGLHPGQLVLIAARPALGKSTLALDIARSAAIRSKQPTVFFSLEMSRSEIAMRLLAAETSIFLQKMRNGSIDQQGWTKITKKQADLSDAPLYIDDSPNLTLVEIRAKCRRMKQQHGLKLIVIDYLQLMSSGKRVENRQQEVSEFSRSLKLLAKELNVPVIALSQLNRGPEQRSDKKPQLSDLRESGSLEQDADIVILLHRERYADSGDTNNDAELIVAKHRNGATKSVTVLFEGGFSRFSDMAQI